MESVGGIVDSVQARDMIALISRVDFALRTISGVLMRETFVA
jgi:hypothetical protein